MMTSIPPVTQWPRYCSTPSNPWFHYTCVWYAVVAKRIVMFNLEFAQFRGSTFVHLSDHVSQNCILSCCSTSPFIYQKTSPSFTPFTLTQSQSFIQLHSNTDANKFSFFSAIIPLKNHLACHPMLFP